MNNPFKHQISEKTIQVAQKHHQKIFKHGQLLINLENNFQDLLKLGTKAHLSKEKFGQVIIQQAKPGKKLVNELKKTSSTQVYTQLTINHIEVTKKNILAVKYFLKIIQSNHNFSNFERK